MSTEEAISAEDAARITAYLDVHAPATKPTAHIVFGTNQPTPAEVVAGLYHEGLAPLIILTGGVNRHNGIVEAQVHRRILLERDVPEGVIRYEDTSATTRENVEQALPFLVHDSRHELLGGIAVPGVLRQEDQPHAVFAGRRQRRRRHLAQEGVGDLNQDARAVAGVHLAPARAAVLQVLEDLKRLLKDRVRFAAFDVDDETDAAGVVLVARVVQAV